MKSLNLKSIPRQHRSNIASLLRRAGFVSQSLKVLNPVIYGLDKKIRKDVKYSELSEFAISLLEMGVVDQALDIFSSIDPQDEKKVPLYRSFCFFSQWDYLRAKDTLESYLTDSRLSPYEKIVGKVNLLSCYVTLNKRGEALELFSEIEKECKEQSYKRLMANSLELMSQLDIHHEQWVCAKNKLNLALKLLEEDGVRDHLFVEKWLSFIKAIESKSYEPLNIFREKAIQHGHWESVREVDFLKLRVSFDQNLWCQVYLGTPNVFYRQKLRAYFPKAYLPESFEFGKEGDDTLDLFWGTFNGESILNNGKAIHRLLYFLSKDYYAPLSLPSLFSKLFPDEAFNIFHSPTRIHQLVARTRKFIEEKKIDMSLEELHGSYRLKFGKTLNFKGYAHNFDISHELLRLFEISQKFSTNKFSREEYMEFTGQPVASAVRLLRSMCERGYLEKMGRGRSTRYYVSSDFVKTKMVA